MADQIEIDLVIKALSEGFDKLGADIGGLGEAAEKTKEPLKQTGLSLIDLKSGIDLAKEAASTFAAVFQQAFEMGKEGATITATADSLTHLAQQSGHAGDLIEQLETAAGGTVDDLDYMGSTIRLLTGETGDLAKSLADAAPQLLTISRAAVKLNPTLGTTAQAYEAITRAIETGQTRALKNYGIVLGDVEDKQDALNQIIEQGGNLIEQVGGNVESNIDTYERFENSVDNLGDSFKIMIDNMGRTSGVVPAFTTGFDQVSTLLQAVNDGLISGADAWQIYARMSAVPANAEEVWNDFTTSISENENEVMRLMNATSSASEKTYTWAENTFYAEQAQAALGGEVVSTTGVLYGLQTAIGKVGSGLDFASQAGGLLNDVLSVQGDSISENNQRLLDFMLATGELTAQEYEDAVAKNKQINLLEILNGALESSMITMEQWTEIVKDGKITTEEMTTAVTKLWGTFLDNSLDVAAEDAAAMEQAIGDAYETMGNGEMFVPFAEKALEAGLALSELAGGAGGLQPTMSTLDETIVTAKDDLEAMRDVMGDLEGMHQVGINVTVTGDPIPTINIGTNQTGEIAQELATGGIVPGSYSQPVPVVAHGSEMVLNPDQQNNLFNLLNSGGGMAGNSSIYVILDGQQIAAAIETRSGQRARQVSGAYRP